MGMDKKSYEIYLTKEHSAAVLLYDALQALDDKREGFSVSWGEAKDDCRIPAIYHEGGWFYALAEYEAPENARPLYHLKIC